MRLLQLFNVEQMTTSNVYAPRQKRIIPLIVGAALAVGTTAYGAHKSAQANKKQRDALNRDKANENAWYLRRYNEDYADTAAGQNLLNRANRYAKDTWRKAAGAQAVAGGTDASAQMAKDSANRMVGETIANIAATDQAQKANVDNQHRSATRTHALQDAQLEAQKAQSIATTAGQASNAILQTASAFNRATSLKGGSNSGADEVDSEEEETDDAAE